MSNILMIPASAAIIFDSNSANSSVISPLTAAPRLSYDNAGGLNITSYTAATSALDRFTVDGATGRLLSVSDALTGTIFSVNDAAGLPIIQVDSALVDVVTMGPFGTNTFVISNTAIGIGTASPSEKLTVSGGISSNSVIYAAGGNSNNWNSAYSSINSLSSSIGGGGSGDTSTYTTVNTNSANWSSAYTTVNTISGDVVYRGGNTVTVPLSVGTNSAHDLVLETNQAKRMVIASGGDVTVLTPFKVDRVAVTSAAATLTLNLTHSGTVLTITNAAAVSATLPTQNTVSTGYNVMIVQGGAGAVTIVAGTGNTINSFGGVRTTAGIHAAASIVCTAANTYNVSGNLI